MMCKNCSKEMGNSEWKYCPFCGNKLSKPFYAVGMEDVTDKILFGVQKRLMNTMFSLFEDSLREGQTQPGQGRGFTVRVVAGNSRNTGQQGARQTSKKPEPDHAVCLKSNRPVPEETVEPRVKIKKLEDKLKIDVALPQVKSIEDVDVLEFENSCEVRAYVGKKLYFKIIEVPANFSLARKNLLKETLALEFSK